MHYLCYIRLLNGISSKRIASFNTFVIYFCAFVSIYNDDTSIFIPNNFGIVKNGTNTYQVVYVCYYELLKPT